MKHTCHVRTCDRSVPRRMLMCRRHWFMVPKALRDRVWSTYQPGQEKGEAEVTTAYLDAADAACRAVEEKEGEALLADAMREMGDERDPRDLP